MVPQDPFQSKWEQRRQKLRGGASCIFEIHEILWDSLSTKTVDFLALSVQLCIKASNSNLAPEE